MAKFRILVLLLIKSSTFWYIDRLPTSSYTEVIHFRKRSGFFGPTLYMCFETDINIWLYLWHQVTDEGVCALARGCADLTFIVMSGIPQLTDRSIITLANACPHIEELYVSGCNLVTRAALRYLVVCIASYVSRTSFLTQLFNSTVDSPVWGRGTPLRLVHLLPHLFPLFTFPFLSLALPVFFFCPSLPFLPE